MGRKASRQCSLGIQAVLTPPAKEATSASAGRRGASPAATASAAALLVALPLDVLELICRHLTMPDRKALASTCCGLWARPDVAASPALWCQLGILIPKGPGPICGPSLGVWLARRKAAVRSLSVEGQVGSPAAVLGSLAGGPLEVLALRGNPAVGRHDGAALQLLQQLSAITRLDLVDCCLQRAPVQLSALSASLASLSLAGNDALGGGSESTTLQPLRQLSGLTELDLSRCWLRRIPQPLTALTALARLSVAGNQSLGHWSKGTCHWAGALSALTALDTSSCGLMCIPPQLSALPRLAELDMSDNSYLGSVGDAFQALPQLGALRRLRLRNSGLAALPPELALHTGLGELDLSCNRELGENTSQAAWAPLRNLIGLRSLAARECGLQRVPAELGALSNLAELTLDDNVTLGKHGEGALEPLQGLSSLSRLGLACCGLATIPRLLAALPALEELCLDYNQFYTSLGQAGWGGGGEQLFQPLSTLGTVRLLGLRGCGLYPRKLQPQLKALACRGVEVCLE